MEETKNTTMLTKEELNKISNLVSKYPSLNVNDGAVKMSDLMNAIKELTDSINSMNKKSRFVEFMIDSRTVIINTDHILQIYPRTTPGSSRHNKIVIKFINGEEITVDNPHDTTYTKLKKLL